MMKSLTDQHTKPIEPENASSNPIMGWFKKTFLQDNPILVEAQIARRRQEELLKEVEENSKRLEPFYKEIDRRLLAESKAPQPK